MASVAAIAVSGVDDVRTVLDHYNQFDDPVEAFKENQRRLQVNLAYIRSLLVNGFAGPYGRIIGYVVPSSGSTRGRLPLHCLSSWIEFTEVYACPDYVYATLS